MHVLILLVLSFALGFPAFATTLQTSAGAISITKIAEGLNQPWAIGFCPRGGF